MNNTKIAAICVIASLTDRCNWPFRRSDCSSFETPCSSVEVNRLLEQLAASILRTGNGGSRFGETTF